jgi:hypothetical protein
VERLAAELPENIILGWKGLPGRQGQMLHIGRFWSYCKNKYLIEIQQMEEDILM